MPGKNERLIEFLVMGSPPYTTVQIADNTNIPLVDILLSLAHLGDMGYIHMTPVCPQMDIVAPRHRLLSMSKEDQAKLVEELNSFEKE